MVKTLLAFLLALILLVGCNKKVAPPTGTTLLPSPQIQALGPPLYLVTVNGKKGFIDRDGKIAIKPIFDRAYPFSDGLAAVQLKGLWGYIDTQGHLVIPPRFVMAGLFSEGLAPFRHKKHDDPWGYVDKSGTVRIKPQFDHAGQFRNGIARVGFETAKSKMLARVADVGIEHDYRFIDRNGKFVPAPSVTHYATGDPDELIQFTEDGLVGYINAKGETVIEPQFQSGLPFSEGLACASQGGLFGYVDKTGVWVVPPRFQYANSFSEGLAGVQFGPKAWGFIDRSGNTVIDGQFNWVYGGFRHGLVGVAHNGKRAYVNTKGELFWQDKE